MLQAVHALRLDAQVTFDVLHSAGEGRNQVRPVREGDEEEFILRIGSFSLRQFDPTQTPTDYVNCELLLRCKSEVFDVQIPCCPERLVAAPPDAVRTPQVHEDVRLCRGDMLGVNGHETAVNVEGN